LYAAPGIILGAAYMTKKENWSLNNVKHPQGDGLQTIPGKKTGDKR
jgi:hypothetical protein